MEVTLWGKLFLPNLKLYNNSSLRYTKTVCKMQKINRYIYICMRCVRSYRYIIINYLIRGFSTIPYRYLKKKIDHVSSWMDLLYKRSLFSAPKKIYISKCPAKFNVENLFEKLCQASYQWIVYTRSISRLCHVPSTAGFHFQFSGFLEHSDQNSPTKIVFGKIRRANEFAIYTHDQTIQ